MKIKEWSNADFFALLEEELEEKGRVRFRVKGTSMQPFLRNGREEVVLEKTGDRPPAIGDICLFRYHGSHILHRLVGKRNGSLQFQGDNVITHCECCRVQDVAGIVVKVVRDGKECSSFPVRWRPVILLHRLHLKARRWAGRILHAAGLR